jgi:hypothetical protein
MRGISTAVDVTVFLLLVSASVTTLALVPDPEPRAVTVDDRANVLGSVTADIEYQIRGSDRRSHGTVASLLARGAVANATIDGRPLAFEHDAFLERIRKVASRALGPDNRTQVVVRWTPYRGSPVGGAVRIGPAPPPRRDVTVATLTVPVPSPSTGGRAQTRSNTDSFRDSASVAARGTVDALLPGGRATLPSNPVSPARVVASSRFRTLADATNVSVAGALSRDNVSLARRRVIGELTDRFAADMRARFEAPEEAAATLRVDTARITLRRWEP